MNNEEFAMAIREYQNELYRFALAMTGNETDAQDAVSEAVVKAYENRNSLKDYKKFKAWIMSILVNTTRTMMKRQQKFVLMETVYPNEEPRRGKPEDLWNIVMELETGFREVVLLYYYENLPLKEISRILRLPEGTVKSRLARARERLKVLVEDSYEE